MARSSSSNSDLTVAILTLNEAKRLPACLAAIPECYPVLVVDSGSLDETVSLAKSLGCLVMENPWPGFAEQRNFVLDKCHVKTKWILFIDADEYYVDRFFSWFESSKSRDDFDVGLVTSLLLFKGAVLRYAPGYPVYHPRLIRRGGARFVRNHMGHGEAPNADARLHAIDIPYFHDWFDGDLSGWLIKHIKLASLEAQMTISDDAGMTTRGKLSSKLHSAFIRVPARFFYHYIIRGGFRDGRRGFEYSLMYTWYEFTKGLLRFGAGSTPVSPS